MRRAVRVLAAFGLAVLATVATPGSRPHANEDSGRIVPPAAGASAAPVADARKDARRNATAVQAETRRPSGPRTRQAGRKPRRIEVEKTVTRAPTAIETPADPATTGAIGTTGTAKRPAGVATAGEATAKSAPLGEMPAVRGTIAPTAPVAVPVAPVGPGAGPVLARGAAIVEEGGRTRVTMELSRPVAIESFGLIEPYRVVIDLPEARFDFGGETGREGKGPIQSWRYGLFMAGRSRLVFDMAGPVRIYRAAVEEPAADGWSRLVLEVAPASREEFVAAHVRQVRTPPLVEGTGILPKGDRQAIRPQRNKPVVVIDPGHGGIDVGTRSPATGTFEKGVVLEIAKLLEKKLIATGRYEVHMTRRDDSFVALGDRVRFARTHHADLFLSVHADAEYDRLVRGATVYTLDDKASDAQAAALAAKENASDALAGVVPDEAPNEVADILIDLTVRETKRFSHVLARNLIDDLKSVGRMVKSNPHRFANFRVLKAHDIPSALIELGFLSNKEDEQLLMSSDWRDKTTNALVASVDRFFQNRIANAP